MENELNFLALTKEILFVVLLNTLKESAALEEDLCGHVTSFTDFEYTMYNESTV